MRYHAHWLAIAVASSLFTIPMAVAGFLPGDRIHLTWASNFAKQLLLGDLYPQWLMAMNSGLGSPTFFFYGPVAYYITAPLVWLLGDHLYGWTAVGLSAWLATFASGCFAYLWLRCVSSQWAALSAALVYVLLPYHFRIDYMSRFAFAEYWAFAWMPLVLFAVEKRNIAGIAGAYALVLATHPPTALLFSIIPLLYGMVRKVPSLRVVAGMALGVALSSAYLLPALLTQSDASLDAMFKGNGYYANHLLFGSTEGPAVPGREQFLERIELTTAYMALMVLLAFAAGSLRRQRRVRFFWFGVATVGTLHCLQVSEPVWRLLPVIQKVQFPWRLHAIVCVAAIALIALAVDRTIRSRSYVRAAVLSTMLLLVGWEVALAKRSVEWAMSHTPSMPPQYTEIDYGEYRPRWVPHDRFTLDGIRELASSTPQIAVIAGSGTVSLERWSAEGVVFRSNSDHGVKVQLKQFYYPCWAAGSGDTTLSIEPAPDTGLLVVNVPAGNREVKLRPETVKAGEYGQAISIAAAFLVLVLAFSATAPASYKSAESSPPIAATEPEPYSDRPELPPHDSENPRTRSVA